MWYGACSLGMVVRAWRAGFLVCAVHFVCTLSQAPLALATVRSPNPALQAAPPHSQAPRPPPPPAPPEQTSASASARFAMISTATPDYIAQNEEPISSRRCYCLRHGYTFVLDVTTSTAPGREPHWNKLPVLRKYLPYYEWIFFVDVDIIVTNSSVRLEDFVDAAVRERPETRFILNDGISVNSGAFFVRGYRRPVQPLQPPLPYDPPLLSRDAWTERFLLDWWRLGGAATTAGREYARFLRDQAGLMEAALWHAHSRRDDGVAGYGGECAGPAYHEYDEFAACWRRCMARLGFPWQHRSTSHITYWARPFPRGFNLRSAIAEPHLAALYRPEELWRFGDAFVHVIDHRNKPNLLRQFSAAPNFFAPLLLPGTDGGGTSSFCPQGDWATMPSCGRKPCHDDLWIRVRDDRAKQAAIGGSPRHGLNPAVFNYWVSGEQRGACKGEPCKGEPYREPLLLAAAGRTPAHVRVWALPMRAAPLVDPVTGEARRVVSPKHVGGKFIVVEGEEGEGLGEESGSGSSRAALRSRFIDFCLANRWDCFAVDRDETQPKLQDRDRTLMDAVLDNYFGTAQQIWPPPLPPYLPLHWVHRRAALPHYQGQATAANVEVRQTTRLGLAFAPHSNLRTRKRVPSLLALSGWSGLGNRLRSVSSAAILARDTGRQLFTHWIPSPNFAVPFQELFAPRCREIRDDESPLGAVPRRTIYHVAERAVRLGVRIPLIREEVAWAASLPMRSSAALPHDTAVAHVAAHIRQRQSNATHGTGLKNHNEWQTGEAGVGARGVNMLAHDDGQVISMLYEGFGATNTHVRSELPDVARLERSDADVVALFVSQDFRAHAVGCTDYFHAKAAFYTTALAPLAPGVLQTVEATYSTRFEPHILSLDNSSSVSSGIARGLGDGADTSASPGIFLMKLLQRRARQRAVWWRGSLRNAGDVVKGDFKQQGSGESKNSDEDEALEAPVTVVPLASVLQAAVVVGVHVRALEAAHDEPNWWKSISHTLSPSELHELLSLPWNASHAEKEHALREMFRPPPPETYLALMAAVLRRRPHARFFVCSNRPAVAAELIAVARQRWGTQIAFGVEQASGDGDQQMNSSRISDVGAGEGNADDSKRSTARGAQASLAAWALLSSTDLVIGPYWSSFSDEAAVAGGVIKVMVARTRLVFRGMGDMNSAGQTTPGMTALVDPLWSSPGCGIGGHRSPNYRKGGVLDVTGLSRLHWFEQLWGVAAWGAAGA